ncbi:hypothetical protein [Staphylococcus cohnii]
MDSMNTMQEIQQGKHIAVMRTEYAKSFLDIAHILLLIKAFTRLRNFDYAERYRNYS